MAALFAILMFIFVVTQRRFDSEITSGSRSIGRRDQRGLSPRRTPIRPSCSRRSTAGSGRSSGSLSADDVDEIRNQVWDQLIQEQVLNSEFKRRHIGASTEEIADAIRSFASPELTTVPDFQTDGQFDLAKYQRWLGSRIGRQYIPRAGGAVSRRDHARANCCALVTADVYLSDAALWQSVSRQSRNGHHSARGRDSARRRAGFDGAAHRSRGGAVLRPAPGRISTQPTTAYLSYVQPSPPSRSPSDTAAALARAEQVRSEIAGRRTVRRSGQAGVVRHRHGAKGGELGEFDEGADGPGFDEGGLLPPARQRLAAGALGRSAIT